RAGGGAVSVTEPGAATATLDPPRWLAPASPADDAVLATVHGPVLDVGCGPARHVRALLDRGVPALGIDVSPAAIRLARRRGATVLLRSIYDRVPGAGRWRAVLLLDGSIGIGGDPAALLRRAASLTADGGTVLVEVEPPEVATTSVTLRLDRHGPSFRWGRVGVDGLAGLARDSGLVVDRAEPVGTRWFGWLGR
ncbi:MAG: class I SAM-dependent methyltransferase, partial [Acidimicrobiales bacterium]